MKSISVNNLKKTVEELDITKAQRNNNLKSVLNKQLIKTKDFIKNRKLIENEPIGPYDWEKYRIKQAEERQKKQEEQKQEEENKKRQEEENKKRIRRVGKQEDNEEFSLQPAPLQPPVPSLVPLTSSPVPLTSSPPVTSSSPALLQPPLTSSSVPPSPILQPAPLPPIPPITSSSPSPLQPPSPTLQPAPSPASLPLPPTPSTSPSPASLPPPPASLLTPPLGNADNEEIVFKPQKPNLLIPGAGVLINNTKFVDEKGEKGEGVEGVEDEDAPLSIEELDNSISNKEKLSIEQLSKLAEKSANSAAESELKIKNMVEKNMIEKINIPINELIKIYQPLSEKKKDLIFNLFKLLLNIEESDKINGVPIIILEQLFKTDKYNALPDDKKQLFIELLDILIS